MPDKIKDMKSRNEELIRMAEEPYMNQAAGNNFYHSHHQHHHHYHASGGGMSSFANQSMMYTKQAMSAATATAQSENHDFEDLLNLIGELYIKDPLKLELSINFWIADSEMNPNMPNNYQKPTQKQVL
jgi:hypothetical protein